MPRLHTASVATQWRDPDVATEKDIHQAFHKVPDVVYFTEIYDPNERALRRIAKEHGYLVPEAAGNDAIAVRDNHRIHTSGAVLVNKAQPGKPPSGGHSKRHAVHVSFDFHGEYITFVGGHWVTGVTSGSEYRREAHDKMSREIVRIMRESARGNKLAFCGGDINARDRAGNNPGYKVLSAGGVRTCWDELGVWPATHGNHTIDFLGSYDPDLRVSCYRARAWPLVKSDHRMISAWWDILPLHT